ncbi:enoyl-CoA hydratase/isomerase family protein [Frankia sp. AiPa1]|uniref:enoyl-CoA hydratase/isomerase family protein n=1 Tax=Frankia sp. AiPa1 TaxID=573492 RepID=UPI00202B9273|nr:enoyl-CoA hydratase/isomerase family protein [Frankia sp. AiPa1]
MTENVVTSERIDDVVVLEIHKPPANFFDQQVIGRLADLGQRAAAGGARALVICSEGRHFCAGADFGSGPMAKDPAVTAKAIYGEAVRLFEVPLPIVAAVQGSAVGGGLGLALAADFRIAAPTTRFRGNFSALGIHQGFGISVTLPRVVGHQAAARMLLTSRTVTGEQALALGLADELVPGVDELRPAALALAGELASQAPLAVHSIRTTLRRGLVDEIREILRHELGEQTRLWATADSDEGISASLGRRPPVFVGR